MLIRRLVLTTLSLAVLTGFSALAQEPFATTTTFSFTRDYSFPPVGIGTTETLRINVVNTAANSSTTPASCTGTITFANASGATIGTATPFTVTSGQIFSADLPFTKGGFTGNRAEVLGTVAVTGTFPAKAPCSLQISLETFDTSSGVTHVSLSNSSLSAVAMPTPAPAAPKS